jgi:hypothetical protein
MDALEDLNDPRIKFSVLFDLNIKERPAIPKITDVETVKWNKFIG